MGYGRKFLSVPDTSSLRTRYRFSPNPIALLPTPDRNSPKSPYLLLPKTDRYFSRFPIDTSLESQYPLISNTDMHFSRGPIASSLGSQYSFRSFSNTFERAQGIGSWKKIAPRRRALLSIPNSLERRKRQPHASRFFQRPILGPAWPAFSRSPILGAAFFRDPICRGCGPRPIIARRARIGAKSRGGRRWRRDRRGFAGLPASPAGD